MPSPRELVENGSVRTLVPINSQAFIKLLEQQLTERGLTVAAFAKIGKINPTCLSTYRHAPPKQLCVQTMRKFLTAFGMTAAKAEAAGLFPRAGKRTVARAVRAGAAVDEHVAALMRSVAVAVTPSAISPPVRIVIADTELTVAPMAVSVKPAVVEHLGWQLTVRRLDGVTE